MTTTGAARGPEPLRLPLTKFLVFAWVIAFLAALWLSGHYVAVIVIVATAAAIATPENQNEPVAKIVPAASRNASTPQTPARA